MMEQRSNKDKGETLTQRPVIFVLDIDRVLFDTERLYQTQLQEFASYTEDEGALDKLKALGKLCVFSEVTIRGTFKFQIEKLDKLGIRGFFEQGDVYIRENKISQISEIFQKYKGGIIFLVDDRVEVLEEAKKIDPDVIAVWMQRGSHAIKAMAKSRAFKPDASVFNLNGLAIMAPQLIEEKSAVLVEK